MPDEKTELGDFTPQASAYAVARPKYPDKLIDRLADRVGVCAGDPVCDVGAGTGICTGQLARRGFQVSALEPNETMRAMADDVSNVTWSDGSFESTGLPDGSQAWIVAAQAFHWADPPRALPEMRRILRPGGQFTAMWNDRVNEASDVLMWTRDAIHRHVPEFDDHYRHADWPDALQSTGDFTDAHSDIEDQVITMTRQRYLNLWRSHNRLNTLAGPVAIVAFFDELQEYLTTDSVDVPYRCFSWTVRAT